MILNTSQLQSSPLQILLFNQIKSLLAYDKEHTQLNWQARQHSQKMTSISFYKFISSEYEMISQQTELLDLIRKQIKKTKENYSDDLIYSNPKANILNILPSQSYLDLSNISSVNVYDDENSKFKLQDQPFRTRFGEQFEKSLINSALSQVQQNCSPQTFQTIKKHVLNSKQSQFDTINQKYQNLLKIKQEIETNHIIKSTQLIQTENQLKQALTRLELAEQEKKKLKHKSFLLSQKQKRIYKMQSNIVFKQKLFNEGKKRYERQKNVFLTIQDRLNKLYTQMHKIWNTITEAMEENQKLKCLEQCVSQGSLCWKKQVMKKCKQQLIDQRNLLKEEQDAIQKEYQTILTLSDQVKMFITEKQITGQENISSKQSLNLSNSNLFTH